MHVALLVPAMLRVITSAASQCAKAGAEAPHKHMRSRPIRLLMRNSLTTQHCQLWPDPISGLRKSCLQSASTLICMSLQLRGPLKVRSERHAQVTLAMTRTLAKIMWPVSMHWSPSSTPVAVGRLRSRRCGPRSRSGFA